VKIAQACARRGREANSAFARRRAPALSGLTQFMHQSAHAQRQLIDRGVDVRLSPGRQPVGSQIVP
jgi:hypothetical protein